MDVTQKQLQKLAQKLLEVFSYQDTRRRGFERYWPLAGPVGTFSEHAVTELEQGMAKALQSALEEALRRQAPRSFHLDADAVAGHLNAPGYQPRRTRPPRRYVRRPR
jgi:hypothetical protein